MRRFSNERSLLSAGVLELLRNGSHTHRDLQQTVANTSVSRGSAVYFLASSCDHCLRRYCNSVERYAVCSSILTNARNVWFDDALCSDFLVNGCRGVLVDRGYLVHGACSAAPRSPPKYLHRSSAACLRTPAACRPGRSITISTIPLTSAMGVSLCPLPGKRKFIQLG